MFTVDRCDIFHSRCLSRYWEPLLTSRNTNTHYNWSEVGTASFESCTDQAGVKEKCLFAGSWSSWCEGKVSFCRKLIKLLWRKNVFLQETDQTGEEEVLQGDEGAEAGAHTVGERLQAAARQQHLPLLRVPGNGSVLGLHSPSLSWFPPKPPPPPLFNFWNIYWLLMSVHPLP